MERSWDSGMIVKSQWCFLSNCLIHEGSSSSDFVNPHCRKLMELKWIGVMMIWFRLRTEKLSSKTSCQDQSSLCYNRDNVGLIFFALLLSPQYVCPTPASSTLWPQGQTAVYLLPTPLRPCQLGQTAEDKDLWHMASSWCRSHRYWPRPSVSV